MSSGGAAPREPSVLICGLDHTNVAPEEAVFRAAGVPFRQVACRTEEEYLARCGEAEALLVQYGAVTRRVIESLPRLRVVVRYGVGVDGVDVGAATERGIPVVNVPDYGTDEVANHAVGLLLGLARKLPLLDRQTRAGRWTVFEAVPVHRLAGQTVGILGCGRIGSRVARKLAGFDVRLLATDPYVNAFPPGVEPVSRDRLLAESDYLTLHCPLTAETRHVIDRAALARMKATAVLVNTARGGLVDLEALVEALRAGRLAGAGLDVTEPEPLDPASPLLRMDQVIVTPHAAWYSEEGHGDLKRRVAEETVRVLRGERPLHCVNPEVFGTAPHAPAGSGSRAAAHAAEPERAGGGEAPTPMLNAMLVADAAIREEGTGKVSLIGIFEQIAAAVFPCRHHALAVYAKMTDAVGSYDVGLELVRLEAETRIGEGRATIQARSRLEAVEVIFHLGGLTFPAPGRYEFRLAANGRHVGSKSFTVLAASVQPGRPAAGG
jgi:D-3-phosphoglycerate dehydrogenase